MTTADEATAGRVNSALRFGLLLCLLGVAAYYALLHARVLGIPSPITQDEPLFVEITAAPNPYTMAGAASCGNVYGPGYAWWARPFVAVIANPYIAHRVASSVALFAMLGVLGWVIRREGAGVIETAAALGIVYILNVSSHSLVASVDLLGAAFYVAAIAASRRGTWGALLTGLACALCATLTKPYFALAWGVVASHLVLFGPRRRALAYLAVTALLAAAVALVLRSVAPFYFFSTFVTQSVASARNASILIDQTWDFGVLACGLVALVVLRRARKRTVSLSSTQPLLSPAIDLWEWAAAVAAAVLLGLLGWHPGNYLVYYYHLLLGPLAVVAARRLADWPRAGRALLCVNLLVLGYFLPPLPGPSHWSELEASVAAVKGPILADPLLEPLSHTHPNVELFSHGQTPSLLMTLDHRAANLSPAEQEVHRLIVKSVDDQNARIAHREFAAIYVSYQDLGKNSAWTYDHSRNLKPLFANYRPTGEVVIYPYAAPYWDRLRHGQHAVHVTQWVPKEK